MRYSTTRLTAHDIVSQNCEVTLLAAPEGRGAYLFRDWTGWPAGAWLLRVAVALAIASLITISNSTPGLADLRALDAARPAFALEDLAGASVALPALKGRAVVVHFFATWCEPCREEFPALDRLAARAREHGVRVVAISVAEPPIRVRRFIEQMPVTFPVLLDQDRAVAKAWDVAALPSTFILDSALNARLVVEQDYDWDRIDLPKLLQHISREDQP